MTTTAMITTAGQDQIQTDFLQLLADAIQFGELGTGTTAATASDTAVESSVSGSNRRWDSFEVGSDYVEFVYTAGFDEFDGNDISEIVGKDSEGTVFFRITFTAQSKTTTNEFIFTIRIPITFTQN